MNFKTFVLFFVVIFSSMCLAQRGLDYINISWSDNNDLVNVDGWNVNVNGQVVQLTKTQVSDDGNGNFSYRLTSLPDGTDFEFGVTYAVSVNAYNSSTTSPTSPESRRTFIQSDINDDGIVDGLDLNLLAVHWAESGTVYADFWDINLDGTVDGLDLTKLATEWGASEPLRLKDVNKDGTIDDKDLKVISKRYSKR